MSSTKTWTEDFPVVIVGAGPAGLTAAIELLEAGQSVLVLEKSRMVGGISRTEEFNGNRIDIGGHRFFSKSERVMEWWDRLMPMEDFVRENAAEALPDDKLLLRSRLSRIFYLRRFFPYPIGLGKETIFGLGLPRMLRIAASYLLARLRPLPEESLENFFINRFGKELYLTFFKDYTEKVWGKECSEIDAAWGAQRIKGLSVTKAITNALFKPRVRETSLIDRFWYPKYGPGSFWERAAERVVELGGTIMFDTEALSFGLSKDGMLRSVTCMCGDQRVFYPCKAVISTMPIKDLALGLPLPNSVKQLAASLEYRGFITVGVLIAKRPVELGLNDNWIYIQEPDVKVGRMQIFNNWSAAMVRDTEKTWIGLEYFANEGDEIWSLDDGELAELAKCEIATLGFCRSGEIEEAHVIRVPKAYPSYFGEGYRKFLEIRRALDAHPNLYCVGRNGMHRYNNMDHSMLSAIEAARQIVSGERNLDAIWGTNAEQEYHESGRNTSIGKHNVATGAKRSLDERKAAAYA